MDLSSSFGLITSRLSIKSLSFRAVKSFCHAGEMVEHHGAQTSMNQYLIL